MRSILTMAAKILGCVTTLRRPLSTQSAIPNAWSPFIRPSSHAAYRSWSTASSRKAWTSTLTSTSNIASFHEVEKFGIAIEIYAGPYASSSVRRELDPASSGVFPALQTTRERHVRPPRPPFAPFAQLPLRLRQTSVRQVRLFSSISPPFKLSLPRHARKSVVSTASMGRQQPGQQVQKGPVFALSLGQDGDRQTDIEGGNGLTHTPVLGVESTRFEPQRSNFHFPSLFGATGIVKPRSVACVAEKVFTLGREGSARRMKQRCSGVRGRSAVRLRRGRETVVVPDPEAN